jgi:hypothetical protein
MSISIDLSCPNLMNMDESPDNLISTENEYNMQYVKKVKKKSEVDNNA